MKVKTLYFFVLSALSISSCDTAAPISALIWSTLAPYVSRLKEKVNRGQLQLRDALLTSPGSYLRNIRCAGQARSRLVLRDWLQLGPTPGYPNLQLKRVGRLWYIRPLYFSQSVRVVGRSRGKLAHRVMRMQSPNTGTKSGETCDMEGWAFAKRTWKLVRQIYTTTSSQSTHFI